MDMMDVIDGCIRWMDMIDGMDGMDGYDGWMDIMDGMKGGCDEWMNGWDG